jgi:hypothetical protein
MNKTLMNCSAVLLLLAMTALISSCRTEETLYTPASVCSHLKSYDNDTDLRDEYDACILEHNEKIQKTEFCEQLCMDHCRSHGQDFIEISVDFSGCRCFCSIN